MLGDVTSRRLRSACSTIAETARGDRGGAISLSSRKPGAASARAGARARRQSCEPVAIWPSRKCSRAPRVATMWCSARCCSVACTAAKASIGRWAYSSTRCLCASVSAWRAWRRPCGACTSCLTELLRHEHASLALAQRCSGVAAPTPLFSALLNYRHSSVPGRRSPRRERLWTGSDALEAAEQRTNYPLGLSIDDLGDGFVLTAQTRSPLAPERICAYMNVALEGLVAALEHSPQTPARTIDILPQDERHRLLVEWNDTADGLSAGQARARAVRGAGGAGARGRRSRLRRRSPLLWRVE